ncbi:20615_t:CDS:2 [Entrophospora sp. SA101]|nr:11551_t:CDS:2 [Entrophospora sp. SA101]CAJ0752119.1 20615_t:CDS:2 [Entrophospora sp. SA101]
MKAQLMPLSEKVLELRFMQRQQEKALREKVERERNKAIGESQWTALYDELDVREPDNDDEDVSFPKKLTKVDNNEFRIPSSIGFMKPSE